MSYVCNVCKVCVPPRRPQRRYAIRRPDGTTHAEIPVCEECSEFLATPGASIKGLRKLLDLLGRLPELPVRVPVPLKPRPQPPPPGFVTNGHDRPFNDMPLKAKPVCDVCGMPVDGGQSTKDAVLCPKHARKAKR